MRDGRLHRRRFLAEVGQGMIVAGIGYTAARELGMTPAFAEEDEPAALERLTFGKRERLAAFLEETPPDRLLPAVVERLRSGTRLEELVAAAALANARAFGGEDYVGFHTFMALAPAHRMALELPEEHRALPVLKVLYRNAARLQESGAAAKEILRPVRAAESERGDRRADAAAIRAAVHRGDLASAEGALAAIADRSADAAWNALLETVQEAPEVHRIVLAHRSWDMLALVGPEAAHTMLRQSLHYCVRNEVHSARHFGAARELLPKLLEEHDLLSREPGEKPAEDAWVEELSRTLFEATADDAAGAVAAALAEGFRPQDVAEAVALAANQLVLRDAGRPPEQARPGKPPGSVHGDSIGVHACDSANAWRHIAGASNSRNSFASLILSGFQVALDRVARGGRFLEWQPRPATGALAEVEAREPAKLLESLDGAIRENDQERACAVAHRYRELGHPAPALLERLRAFAISEDGALHAEKYYWTTSDEFARTRPAFRDRQLVALARVTASQYGTPAPGIEEARRLLRV